MAKLNTIANIIYEISLYTLVIGSYQNYHNLFLFLVFIMVMGTLFITGFPSAYQRMGYQVSTKRVDVDALLKVLQLFIVLGITPLIGMDKIQVSLLLLMTISILNIHNQWVLTSQIEKENITIRNISDLEKRPETKEQNDVIKRAWQLVIPFFLLGLLNQTTMWENLMVIGLICIIEAILLRRLYVVLISYSPNPNMRKEFFYSTLKFIFFMVLLGMVTVIQPSSLFTFIITGMVLAEFVNLVRKQEMDGSLAKDKLLE